MHDQSWLWHGRLRHANMDLISQLNKDELVRGLPKINFQKDKVCEACQVGKQIKNSFKIKNFISTFSPLELFHMDLFGPLRTPSLGGKSCAYVIVDDFSKYTCVLFLSKKNEAFYEFSKFAIRFKMKKVLQLFVQEVIMRENLKILILKSIAMSMELTIIFSLLELLNKMG